MLDVSWRDCFGRVLYDLRSPGSVGRPTGTAVVGSRAGRL